MMITLTASDGHRFECWMTPAQGPRRGGVVLLQEIFGVTDQLKRVADRYAQWGYEVAIPALFDRQQRGAVIGFDQPALGRDLMLGADIGLALQDISASVAAMQDKAGGVAVIGFCWGGGLALRATQMLNIQAGIAFYGTRLASYLDHQLQAPFMGHFGRSDDHTPPDVLAALHAYLPQAVIHLYDAGHAFANDERPSFVMEAAQTAHERTHAFLGQYLGNAGAP